MNFDYSKLTALDMRVFYLLALRGNYAALGGSLVLIAKTGVDLNTILAADTAKMIEVFWRSFPDRAKQIAIEELLRGEDDDE